METLRFQVVGEAFRKKPLDVKAPAERPAKYFGQKVFNREKMYKYLPKDVYEKMLDVIDNGAPAAAYARRSRPAATRPGTPRAPFSSSTTRSASPPFL